jgi:hypothetical protein
MRFVAAACLLAAGYVHWHLFEHGYRYIPTIGTMFEINFVASAVVGVVLIFRRDLVVLLAGVALGIGTLGAFVGSRLPGGIFGFQERGLNPAPYGLLALLTEIGAVLTLGYLSFRNAKTAVARTRRAAINTQPVGR